MQDPPAAPPGAPPETPPLTAPDPAFQQRFEESLRQFRTILIMLAVVMAGAAIAMITIADPAPHLFHDPKPGHPVSPYGYTVSLALFLLPLIALASWFYRHGKRSLPHMRAFRLTILIFFVLFTLLDVFLALTFFKFPNEAATLGINLPGWNPGHGFQWKVPIEEFAFYLGGVLVVVMMYIWAKEDWFARYSLSDEELDYHAKRAPPVIQFHWRSLAYGVFLFALALAYKKFGPHDHHLGFPAYFMFLLALIVFPASLFLQRIGPFINQRAFVFTLVSVVLISLIWEATLAMPYGWWGYHHEWMIGIFIKPWYNLPLEATFLWISAGWANVFVYELLVVYYHSDLPFLQVLFGRKDD